MALAEALEDIACLGAHVILGTVAYGAAEGLAVLSYYGFKTLKSALKNDGIYVNSAADKWPAHVRHRMGTTFKYLGGSLALTFGAATLVSQSSLVTYARNSKSVWVDIGVVSAIVGSWLICKHIPYKLYIKKHAAWAIRCGVMGSIFGVLASGVSVLVVSCLSTAGIVAGYVTLAVRDAYWFPEKVCLSWIKYLRIGVGVVSISSLAICFLPDNKLKYIIVAITYTGSSALLCGYILHDTQQMIAAVEATPIDAPFDPVNAQMSLFSDTLWIFVWFIPFIEAVLERI